MVTKPNKAYVKQAPKVREVEQELYEDMEIGDDGEAIYEETMWALHIASVIEA